MARRRILVQDINAEEDFNMLSSEAQLLYLRMLPVSDDCGVVPANLYTLAALVNPPERIRKSLKQYLDEIVRSGLGYLFVFREKIFFAYDPEAFDRDQSFVIYKRTKSEFLKISADEYEILSKKFLEVPRDSRRNFDACHASIESKSKGMSREGGVGGEGGETPLEEPQPSERELKRQAEEIYDSYPTGFKVGKPDALRAIRKAMRTTAAKVLLERTKAYAEAVQRSGYEYVPNPATWFNQERYNDEPESWIRHRNGSSGGNPGSASGPALPHGLMRYAAIMDEHRKDSSYQGRCEFYTLVATGETVGRLRRPDAEAIPPDYATPITTAANGAQAPAASANTATNAATAVG